MTSRSDIRTIDPQSPEPDAIADAARILHRGGIVVFPTRCLYGLAADAFNPDAVERLFSVKQRPSRNPILILIHDREAVERLVRRIPKAGHRLMDRFWPGRLTLVFEAAPEVPDILTGGTGKLGIRLCGHPAARALARAVGGPITGTSANLSGESGCSTVDALPSGIMEQADLILDAGRLSGGIGSSVVDVTRNPPAIVREGVVPAKDIHAALDPSARNSVDKPD